MSALSSPWPAHLRQTYSIVRPRNGGELGQFWRPASCEEADCAAFQRGWITRLPADDGRADYIRRHSGRRFTEERDATGLVVFRFAPGQPCFAASTHQVPVEREPLYVVRGGDSRAWTGTRRVHASAIDWRDDFGENQERLADLQQKKG